MSHACALSSTLLAALLGLTGAAGATVIPFPVKAKTPSCEDNVALPPPLRLGSRDAVVFRGHATRLRVADFARFFRVDPEIPKGFKLDRISPDGRFYVLMNEDFSVTKLVSKHDGRVVAERSATSTGVTFSQNSKFAALRTNDAVEILDLGASGEVVAKYHLGAVDEKTELSDGSTSSRDARGELHYLPGTSEIVAFFDGFQPLILKLFGAPNFRVLELAKPDLATPVSPSRPVAAWARGTALDRRYGQLGYVSPSEKVLVARVTEAFLRQTTLEFYDVRDRSFLRSVTVGSMLVGEIALSPGDRFFAVALPLKNTIEVFDFERSSRVPRWEIELAEGYNQQVRFLGEGELLVTRDDDKAVFQFSLR